jgi:hypothetical protein
MPAVDHGRIFAFEMSRADAATAGRPVVQPSASSWLSWLPLALMLALGFIAVVALEVFVPRPDRAVGVIFPTDTTDDSAFATIVAAGGRPIRMETSAFAGIRIWVALGDTGEFPAAIRHAGALFVVNPYAFGGCLLGDRRAIDRR